ncbi:mitochondrial RNA binding protein 1 [Novymonas esmeraldas]|uniref:Mitochondrial RNA binding protein 1 n=1 Tax=Novymonas esmeraldas TaxID=1808958 RepID=A0AAW0EWC5_9TRYP
MFRLLSARLPLAAAAATAPAVRFQSQAAAGASSQSRYNDGRGTRNRISTVLLPKFEIHDVRDEPAHGSMTRVSIDGKQLLVSQFPQLGPRKVDPNDTTAQFNRDRRISLRFRHTDLAGLVSVVEKRISSHHVQNNAFDLLFERTDSGYVLRGQVQRSGSDVKEEWAIRFENHFAVTMEHFLESALTESFGFSQYQRLVEEQNSATTANQGNAKGNRSSDNSNDNKQKRRRNKNNNNNSNNNNTGNGNQSDANKSQEEL